MKNSIIYLGIAFISLTNAQSFSTEKLQSIQDMSLEIAKDEKITQNYSLINNHLLTDKNKGEIAGKFPKPAIEIENDSDNQIDLLIKEKPIEEVIIDGNKIIESNIDNIFEPLYLEMPIEYSINEDLKIIESNLSNVIYPLDFNIINRTEVSLLPLNNIEFINN